MQPNCGIYSYLRPSLAKETNLKVTNSIKCGILLTENPESTHNALQMWNIHYQTLSDVGIIVYNSANSLNKEYNRSKHY